MHSLGPPPALHKALSNSLTSGCFIDTKFYVFSRRRASDGKVDLPRALYACSSVLKESSAYFAAMLSSCFTEGALKDMAGGFSEDTSDYLETYDYESDSDLDEEEDPLVTEDELPSAEVSAHVIRPGPVVVIRDSSFLTFQSVLIYLHAGEISFKGQTIPDGSELPLPSPKSVYRLADKYGLDELKSLAFQEIRRKILPQNMVHEAFSTFTSWYPEIRNFYTSQLDKAIREPSDIDHTKILMDSLDEFGSTNGSLRNSCETFVGLADALFEIKAHPKLEDGPPNFGRPIPPYWRELKNAIIESIYTGRFIDSSINCYSNRSRSKSERLYFSRAAIRDAHVNFFVRAKNRTREKHRYSKCYESDSDLDEDCDTKIECRRTDSDSQPRSATSINAWDLANISSRLVVKPGAYKTWKSAIYFIYTGDISFARLRSQNSKSENNPDTASPEVPTCSPKSMYLVAELLGLRDLQELALQDLLSKIEPDNLVHEFFSEFFSLNRHLLESQTDALFSQYSSEEIHHFLTLRLKSIPPSAHCSYTEALKSIFLHRINDSYFKPVLLRCSLARHTGTKKQWTEFRNNRECSGCWAEDAHCERCDYSAHFYNVLFNAEKCPGCGRRLA